jgi:predicted RNase H-like HicB family nuclease
MTRTYVLPVEVETLEDGRFLAVCPTLQGCHAEGETVEEALEYIEDIARIMIELRHEEGLPLPKELATIDPAKIKVELVSTERA